MDITAAVRERNELADRLNHAMSRGAVIDPAVLDRLDELIVSADEWIGCGGFAPNCQTHVARRLPDTAARAHFAVSQEMLTWRKRMSGGMRMKPSSVGSRPRGLAHRTHRQGRLGRRSGRAEPPGPGVAGRGAVHVRS